MLSNHNDGLSILNERVPQRETLADPNAQLVELRRLRDEHPLWNNRLFQACRAGTLDREDLRYVFSQYQLYSRNFTRFIAALMANCDNDLFRSRLSENLWEEGGGCVPEHRHAELFRRFLAEVFDLSKPDLTDYEACTQYFVNEYLAFCLRSGPAAGSAFLSLGTEGIVARMYEVFMAGFRHAGIREDQLTFFKIHIECDDDHARTLEQLMLSYAGEPRWFETCKQAMCHAMDLRLQFFERIVDGLQRRRLGRLAERINAGVSLCGPTPRPADVRHRDGDSSPELYTNRVDAEGIEFTVNRIPLAAEVLDPRRVVVPVGKRNELHRHAHETFIYILSGTGRVHIDALVVDVAAGDSILVPRWALHQTENTGASPLSFLAVTDYHLTKRAYIGDAKAYRLDETANSHRRE
jgi:pyrroloquinoline quinone (PQQ) biosynthesis protein C/mannose-6-phosphate isomerase-like protein (cupin superfamily)